MPIILSYETPRKVSGEIKELECEVLDGVPNQDKVKIKVDRNMITVHTMDNNELFTVPIDQGINTGSNMNQLTIASPKLHFQLQTSLANELSNYIHSNSPSFKTPKQSPLQTIESAKYYVMCSPNCGGAIDFSCKRCYYHPSDFKLYNYGVVYCNNCNYETYVHYCSEDEISSKCKMCQKPLILSKSTAIVNIKLLF